MPKGEHKLHIDIVKSECLKRDIEFVDSEYINNSFKHRFRCLKHNKILKSMVRSVVNGNHKLICCGSGAKKHSIEYIKDKCMAKGFELVSKEYNGINVKHDFRCMKHDKIYSVQPRQLILADHGLKCCGHEKLSGENNYSWNPELSKKERLYRRSSSLNNKWIKLVKQREGRTCQICGESGLDGFTCIAHHLESYRANKVLRYEVSNGACMCSECHRGFHREYGYGNNTKAQFEQFKIGKNKQEEVN